MDHGVVYFEIDRGETNFFQNVGIDRHAKLFEATFNFLFERRQKSLRLSFQLCGNIRRSAYEYIQWNSMNQQQQK